MTDNSKLDQQKVIFKKLMNPLINFTHCIATISVYVFVESFETLKSHIFNNIKLRFRHENHFDKPECFA